MVFDPTFHEIDDDAERLPDLDGSEPTDDDELLDDDIPADELPPTGA